SSCRTVSEATWNGGGGVELDSGKRRPIGDARRVVPGDNGHRLRDGNCAVGRNDRIVGEVCTTRRGDDRIATGGRANSSRGRKAFGKRVAVDCAGHRPSEGWISSVVDAASISGGHRQSCLVDDDLGRLGD